MNAIICAALGALAFYFSAGLGDAWPVAWIAAAPLLWLAYGDEPWWQVALASFAAFAVGQCNMLPAYAGYIPALPLAFFIAMPAVVFAGLVLLARFVQRRVQPWFAVLFFPTAWTSWEYLFSLVSPHGTFGSLAYSQVGMPALIQDASVFGLFVITFLLSLFASGLALVLRKGKPAWSAGAVAIVLFAINLGFGLARLSAPQGETARVGVIATDLPEGDFSSVDGQTPAAFDKYAEAVRGLAKSGAKTIVVPETIAQLKPQWRSATLDKFSRISKANGQNIIVGFADFAPDRTHHNVAMMFSPDGKTQSYVKRHLLPGLEYPFFSPGGGAGLMGGGQAVAICKDMDFPRTLRDDAKNGITLMFVPANDFVLDGWLHARMAIIRGVEDGFALARSAAQGVVTISDAEGRVVASAPVIRGAGFATAVADVARGPGATIYVRIGDVFAWACMALFAVLTLVAIVPRKPAP